MVIRSQTHDLWVVSQPSHHQATWFYIMPKQTRVTCDHSQSVTADMSNVRVMTFLMTYSVDRQELWD